MEIIYTVALILLFLITEGFFSGSELAMISFNRIKIRHLAESGDARAVKLESLLEKPEKLFGATSVGTNLSVFAGTAIATAFAASHLGAEEADFRAFIVMGPLTLILGEIVPKMVYRARADSFAPYLAGLLSLSQKIFAPVLVVTAGISKMITSMFLGSTEVASGLVSREEIRFLTKLSEDKLDLAHEEKKMIHKIFEFKTNTVDTVMRPLVTVVGVPSVATLAEVKARIAESGYSRMPVFDERIFNIVGIISAFDILRCKDLNQRVVSAMSPGFYTPIAKRNPMLLKEMQEDNVHMAVVVDEYGGAIGIVTMEDLVEEIVGEIEDEYDSPVKFYEKRGEGRYIIDAMMEIDSINEELGLDAPKGDYETLGGFVIDTIERIPRKGEMIAAEPYLITIADATERMVKSVELLDLRGDAGKTKTGGK